MCYPIVREWLLKPEKFIHWVPFGSVAQFKIVTYFYAFLNSKLFEIFA